MTNLIEQLRELHVLAALLQLRQGLQELHGGGHARQLPLAHHVLYYTPHVDRRRGRLLRRRQRLPPLMRRLRLFWTPPLIPRIKIPKNAANDVRLMPSAGTDIEIERDVQRAACTHGHQATIGHENRDT